MFVTLNEERSIHTKCEKCDEGLCKVGCFKEYHKKGNNLLDAAGEKPVHPSTDNKKKYLGFCE
jgi:hypothetical protein